MSVTAAIKMPPQSNRVRKSSMKKLSFENDLDREDSIKSNETKIVQFSTIEIRDYSLCLGDHPDVNRGAPVSLDWEYQSQQSFDLEEYEQKSTGKKKTRQDMILLAFQREYKLRKLGYSTEEIKTGSKSVKKDRKRRSQTRRTMIFEPFMVISENTRRWISKRKSLQKQIGKEIDRSSISSCRDSIMTASTISSLSEKEDFMTENIMVCVQ